MQHAMGFVPYPASGMCPCQGHPNFRLKMHQQTTIIIIYQHNTKYCYFEVDFSYFLCKLETSEKSSNQPQSHPALGEVTLAKIFTD
jgi:hypothetical protein